MWHRAELSCSMYQGSRVRWLQQWCIPVPFFKHTGWKLSGRLVRLTDLNARWHPLQGSRYPHVHCDRLFEPTAKFFEVISCLRPCMVIDPCRDEDIQYPVPANMQ